MEQRILASGHEGGNPTQMRVVSHFEVLRVLRFYQLCGTAEPNDPNEDAPFYAAHQCVLKKGRQSPCGDCVPLHELQLLPQSPDVARHARNGSGITDHLWTKAEIVELM
jgi:hypothetical protein